MQPWVGLPLDPPSGAARSQGWQDDRVRELERCHPARPAGRCWPPTAAERLSTVARKAKAGFETAIAVRAGYQRFELQALNANGQVIGTSKAFGLTG